MSGLAPLRAIFHFGLLVALGALVAVVAGISQGSAPAPNRLEASPLYLAGALAHVVCLSLAARSTPEPLRAKAVSFLYTAGFVHTLLALGMAIALSGAELITQKGIDAAILGTVLFPMGAAIIPHAIAVWVGQDIEAGLPASAAQVEATLFSKLKHDARTVEHHLERLETKRRELLAAFNHDLEMMKKTAAAAAASFDQTMLAMHGGADSAKRIELAAGSLTIAIEKVVALSHRISELLDQPLFGTKR